MLLTVSKDISNEIMVVFFRNLASLTHFSRNELRLPKRGFLLEESNEEINLIMEVVSQLGQTNDK